MFRGLLYLPLEVIFCLLLSVLVSAVNFLLSYNIFSCQFGKMAVDVSIFLSFFSLLFSLIPLGAGALSCQGGATL